MLPTDHGRRFTWACVAPAAGQGETPVCASGKGRYGRAQVGAHTYLQRLPPFEVPLPRPPPCPRPQPLIYRASPAQAPKLTVASKGQEGRRAIDK